MIIKIPIGNIVIRIAVYFLKYCNVSGQKNYNVIYSPISKIVKNKIRSLVNSLKIKEFLNLLGSCI